MAKIADPSIAAEPGPQVHISIGELHLDTLRKHGSPASLPTSKVELAVVDLEGNEEVAEMDYEVVVE